LAPLLGSLFVEYATWRWVFYVNIPICLLSLLTLLPYKEVYEPKRAAVDYMGALLFAAAISLLLLVTVVEQGRWWYGAAGALLLVVFYYFEKRQPSPLVPLSLVHHRTLKWMNINGFVSCVALFGTSSYIPLFLQNVAHLSVFASGVALLGSSVGWMIAAVPAGKWILRYGYRPLLIIGNVLLVASGLFLALLNESHGFWYVFFIMFLQGLSFGLTSTVGVIGSQQLADAHEKGIATAFFMFCRNIGTAIGVTVMGAFLAQASAFMTGIRHLFLFGLIGSIIALITSFFIRDEAEAGRNSWQPEGTT